MKYCPNCNEEYDGAIKFCMKCGSALQEKAVQKAEKKPVKKGKIIELCILVAVLLAVIIGGVIFVSSYFSPSAKIDRFLAAGDWDAAQEVYAEAIQGDEEAEEEVKRSLAEIVNQVKTDYTNQTMDYDAAQNTLNAIKNMAGEVDGYAEVNEYISKLMKSRKAYTSAEQLLANKEYAEAVNYYKQVWMEDANYADAQAKIKTAKEAYKTQVLALVDGYKADEKYQDAIELLQKAKTLLEDDGEIDALVIQYQKEDVKKNFLAYEAAKDYAGGIAYAEANSSVIGADPELSAKLTVYMNSYRSDVMTKAETAFTEQGYSAAVAIVDEAFNVLAGDKELENAKTEFANRYRTDVLNQAEAVFGSQGYQAAVDVINEGMRVLNDDMDLYNAKENYESYAPKLLFDMVQLEGSELVYTLTSGTDNVGNQYQNAYKWYVHHGSTCTYILNDEYSRLEGMLALSSGDKNEMYEVGFAFYGDGKFLGYSPMFTAGVRPQSFSIDVVGVTDLRIECIRGGTIYGATYLYTEGFYLYK